ncbi:MAG: hypothetical protein Q9174_004401 [Haloplaca sp. 1 TL-2023]
MSFGVSVGDFVTLGQLSWKIYKRCKESAGVYAELTGEVNGLRSVLQETEELLSEQELTSQQKERLLPVRQGCESVLKDLHGLLARYESLATSSRRGFDRMGMALQDVTSIRHRLTSNVVLLDAFNNSSSHAKLQDKFDRLISEIRAGKREGSVLSAKSFDTAADTQEMWDALRRDLEDIGISPQVIKEQRSFILDWFREAVASGLAGESPPLAEGESNKNISEQDLDSALGSQQILERGNPGRNVDHVTDALGSQNALPKLQQLRMPNIPEHTLNIKPPLSVSYLINRLKGTDTLHSAAKKGDERRIFEILLRGDYVNARDHNGKTALHFAVESFQSPTIRTLLDHRANVNIADATGVTALHIAAERNNDFATLVLLRYGANVNARTLLGWTALHYAAENAFISVLDLLLDFNADIEAKTIDGETSLLIYSRTPSPFNSLEQGEKTVGKALLEAGANVHARNMEGETPLHVAVKHSRTALVEDLLRHGASVRDKTYLGKTALGLARHSDIDERDKIEFSLRIRGAEHNLRR